MASLTHEDLRNEYVQCRTYGHAWFEQSASGLGKPERGYMWMLLACTRCTTEREDLVDDRTGDVFGRKYRYPDGYEINETVVRSQLRLEWSKRQQNASQRLRTRKRAS